MKGVDRYYGDYNPGPHASAGVYDTENFCENLNELLRLKNLTQAEAARRSDLDPALLNSWLTGKTELNLYNFTKLCAGLEAEPNWLLAKHELINRRKRTYDKP